MIPDLCTRWNGSELMDDPACDETKLLRTVAQFRTINLLVGRYRTLLTQTFLADMQRDPVRSYHAVDLGAGGCDIAVWLLRTARRRGLSLRVTALDADPRIVAFAQRQYGHEPGLTIRHGDLAELATICDADYLFMNHVLHHLRAAGLHTTARITSYHPGRLVLTGQAAGQMSS